MDRDRTEMKEAVKEMVGILNDAPIRNSEMPYIRNNYMLQAQQAKKNLSELIKEVKETPYNYTPWKGFSMEGVVEKPDEEPESIQLGSNQIRNIDLC